MRMHHVSSLAAGLFIARCLTGQEVPVAPATVSPKSSPGFGITDRSYVRVSAAEFTPQNSSCGYVGSGAGRYPLISSCPIYANFHAPGGALLTYLEYDYCDTSNSADLTLKLFECDNEGQGCAQILTALHSSGLPGCSFTADDTLSHRIDNFHHLYLLEAQVGVSDATNLIESVIVGYRLEVSPAPATATFNDVPTSNPFFQYIEALAGSGITAGCGANNYCPDAPITRAQMAVYLSKALGLHWAGY
jgi:hypothetical protein